MTEEQIKQNAEIRVFTENSFRKAYKKLILTSSEEKIAKDFYVAGAHSRDEEIEELELSLEAAADVVKTLTKQLNELHNPWISVNDRLPKYCTVPSTEQYIENMRYWDSKTAPIYLVICSDPQGDYYQFANFLMFPEDKKPSWVFAEDNIKRNCVTHWMPIPNYK